MLRLLPICIAALISIFPFECSLGPEKADVPISALAHEDPVLREEATMKWAYYSQYTRNLRMLITALDDEDANIRKGVCCALYVGLEVPVLEIEPVPGESDVGERYTDPRKVLGPLIERLTDEDESVRTWAALAISQGDPEYTENIPHIINGLHDMELWFNTYPTSKHAADMLPYTIKFPLEYTDDLMEILRDPPVAVNIDEETTVYLEGIKFKAANRTISAEEITSSIEWSVIRTLCRIEPDSKELLPLLREALSLVENERLQKELLNAIGEYAPRFDEAVQLLVDLTSDANDDIAVGAIECLGRLGADNDEMFPILFDLTEHINQKVADSAVEIVCEHWRNEPGVLERMSELASNQHGPAGKQAAKELLKYDDLPLETLIDILIPKVGKASKSIKDAVYERGEEVIPALLEYLGYENVLERRVAGEMLQRFVDEKGKEILEPYGDPDELAIDIKITSGDELGHEYLPILRERIEDENLVERCKAAWGLGRLEPVNDEIIRLMFETYESADERTAYIAKMALERLAVGSEEFAPVMKEFLDSDNHEVKKFALTGLWVYKFIPLEDTVPIYIELLQCDDAWVRQGVACALREHARIDAEIFVDAIPALIEALDDEGDGVANYACQALGKFGAYAVDALPKLRECAAYKPGDSSELNDRATWAKRAIEKIEEDLGE